MSARGLAGHRGAGLRWAPPLILLGLACSSASEAPQGLHHAADVYCEASAAADDFVVAADRKVRLGLPDFDIPLGADALSDEACIDVEVESKGAVERARVCGAIEQVGSDPTAFAWEGALDSDLLTGTLHLEAEESEAGFELGPPQASGVSLARASDNLFFASCSALRASPFGIDWAIATSDGTLSFRQRFGQWPWLTFSPTLITDLALSSDGAEFWAGLSDEYFAWAYRTTREDHRDANFWFQVDPQDPDRCGLQFSDLLGLQGGPQATYTACDRSATDALELLSVDATMFTDELDP